MADLGIEPMSLTENNWVDDPNVVVIVAYQGKEMVAGMRLHCQYPDDTFDLPMSKFLKTVEPNYVPYINELQEQGVAECCGMWNARSFSNKRVNTLLGIAGFSLMPALGIEYTVGLIAKYTLSRALKVGYRIEKQFGENGYFEYPKPGFYGIVIRTDLETILEHARPDWRRRVLSLSSNPRQNRVETTDTAVLEVDYDIELQVPGQQKHNSTA